MALQPHAHETKDFFEFLQQSPTAWHAVENMRQKLLKQSFTELQEGERWRLEPGHRYFVIRNGSSLCVFIMPMHAPFQARILAAHTDSPALKVKPHAEFSKDNMEMVGVEVYGAPLLSSWLNRDLAIAGRVSYLDKTGRIRQTLIHITDHPFVIPQLAIHLDRQVNEEGLKLNKQEHLSAFAAIKSDLIGNVPYIERILKEKIDFQKLLVCDLFLFPLEPPRHLGFAQETIAAYRLDNLVGTYTAFDAIINSDATHNNLLQVAVFWDSEEIGSETQQGAASPFLPQCLERIAIASKIDREGYFCLLNNSLCISIDLGHALHPNYPEKHEPRHNLLLNNGIILKFNAQHKYATDANSGAFIVNLCHEHNIFLQKFVSRSDIPSGSTIGPIHAALTGMPTVDVGIAQLSMHSCRELIGTEDFFLLQRTLKLALTAQA